MVYDDEKRFELIMYFCSLSIVQHKSIKKEHTCKKCIAFFATLHTSFY